MVRQPTLSSFPIRLLENPLAQQRRHLLLPGSQGRPARDGLAPGVVPGTDGRGFGQCVGQGIHQRGILVGLFQPAKRTSLRYIDGHRYGRAGVRVRLRLQVPRRNFPIACRVQVRQDDLERIRQ